MYSDIKLWLITFLVAVVVGLGLYFAGDSNEPDAYDPSLFQVAKVYPKALALKDFSLNIEGVETLSQKDLEGKWSILFFGFTHCPDICPTTLSSAARLDRILRQQIEAERVPQVVFVSVDPDRDKLDLLKSYVTYFNEDFIGATGDDEALQSLTRQLGVLYIRETPDDPDYPDIYNVDHSAGLYLIDPSASLSARIDPPHGERIPQIVEDILLIQRRYRQGP